MTILLGPGQGADGWFYQKRLEGHDVDCQYGPLVVVNDCLSSEFCTTDHSADGFYTASVVLEGCTSWVNLGGPGFIAVPYPSEAEAQRQCQPYVVEVYGGNSTMGCVRKRKARLYG